MLKKLQRQFILIALLALITMVFVEMFAVNIITIYNKTKEAHETLYQLAETEGKLKSNEENAIESYIDFFNPFRRPQITVNTPYSTKYFIVKFNDNRATDIQLDHIEGVSNESAFNLASHVLNTKDEGYGIINYYRYYLKRDVNTNSSTVVFIDYRNELDSTLELVGITLLVGLVCILLMIWPIYLMSKKALKPVEKSIEKQKQFITDAGHELKTPLAIINANTEVIEMCEGESEWTESIKNQTQRLDGLIKDMVTLTKLEEKKNVLKQEQFDLTAAAQETIGSFEAPALRKNITLAANIKDNIRYVGNEGEIRQLLGILGDNAVKYTPEGGTIVFSVTKIGKTVTIEQSNDCENMEKEKLEHLFDRFYRADTSRARETGGYGIGLSIAQVIVERHKGKISVHFSKNNRITFKVVL